jgi:hypothetical protein
VGFLKVWILNDFDLDFEFDFDFPKMELPGSDGPRPLLLPVSVQRSTLTTPAAFLLKYLQLSRNGMEETHPLPSFLSTEEVHRDVEEMHQPPTPLTVESHPHADVDV